MRYQSKIMKMLNPKKPSDMFVKAALFFIFFVIVLIFFIITSKNVKSVEPGSSILNGVTRYKGFTDKEKEDLRVRNAGFWQYCSDTGSTINISDRFELKPNGIFWEVTQSAIGLPSGTATRFIHIITGYLNPFTQLAAKNKDSILCDVHIIRQVYIMGKDTCYGASNNDTTWNIAANGKRFEFGNRTYSEYDTSGPALAQFFPAGALDIIDKPSDNSYKLGNKTVFVAKNRGQTPGASNSNETFDFCPCSASNSFEFFAQKAIASDMSAIKIDTLTPEGVQKTIDAYYRYFIETSMKNALPSSTGKPENAKVIFDITRNGKVSNAAVVKLSPINKKLEQTILSYVTAWTFPQWKSGTASLHIEREFWF